MEQRIGTSGWSYDDWDGEVYPHGTRPGERRDVYAQQFDTVELNASFYRWPRQVSFVTWGQKLPEGFRMTVKAPRGLTHASYLRSIDRWIEPFERAWADLGSRAGVLLLQLHPRHEREDAALDRALSAIPDHIRVAVEPRHPSWHCEEVKGLLEHHRAAYVVMSGANLPCHLWATTDFVYLRLHGPDHQHLYAGSYSDQDLAWWADRCREWQAQGRDVWVYFNNDYHGNAPRNARTLRSMLGGTPPLWA